MINFLAVLDNNYTINNCAAILLAAGASTRLGFPKQLLIHRGKSFLQNIISAAADASLHPVIVVVGANASRIKKELTEQDVHIINNNEWQEGLASSIRCGIQELGKINPASDAAIIMVCDQPYISAALLNNLLTAQKEIGKPIVASSYSGVAGTPALFHKSFFPELLLLKGDKGAGKLLQLQSALVATVPFPEGAIDIDTIEDLKKLRQED